MLQRKSGDIFLQYEEFLSSGSETRTVCGAAQVDLPDEIQNIVKNIDGHRTNPTALELELHQLFTLSVDDEARSLIGASDAIRATADSLMAFPTNESIQKKGIAIFIDICRSSEGNKQRVGEFGGIHAIVCSIRHAIGYQYERAGDLCDALSTCCEGSEFNQDIAMQASGMEVVLAMMRAEKQSEIMQEKCLRTLHALTGKSLGRILELYEAGGVEEVMATLRQSSKEAVQITGMQLLSKVLQQSHVVRACHGSIGFICDIQTSLPRYYICSPYVRYCSTCLRFLAFVAEHRVCMAESNIIRFLFKALQIWKNKEHVVSNILLALGNMTFDFDRAKHSAACDGGAAVLVTLLVQYDSHTSISEQLCRLLRNIAHGNFATRRHCLKSNVASALAEAMKRFPGAAGVQEHAAAALINLARSEQSALRNINVHEHIQKALILHHGTGSTSRQLAHLFQLLSSRSIIFSGFFSGCRLSSRRPCLAKSTAEEILDEPVVVSAFAALSQVQDITEY